MKLIALLTLGLVLSGCGSINTVLRGDEVTSRELIDQKSYCATVPRIYSGVYYDFCLLNAPPQPSRDGYAMPGLLIDAAVCAVLDTVALPYTIYRQNQDGSIDISPRTWKRES